jgi:hypothetical protein
MVAGRMIVSHVPSQSGTTSEVCFQIAGRSFKDRCEGRIDRFKFACGDSFVGAHPRVNFPCGYR